MLICLEGLSSEQEFLQAVESGQLENVNRVLKDHKIDPSIENNQAIRI